MINSAPLVHLHCKTKWHGCGLQAALLPYCNSLACLPSQQVETIPPLPSLSPPLLTASIQGLAFHSSKKIEAIQRVFLDPLTNTFINLPVFSNKCLALPSVANDGLSTSYWKAVTRGEICFHVGTWGKGTGRRRLRPKDVPKSQRLPASCRKLGREAARLTVLGETIAADGLIWTSGLQMFTFRLLHVLVLFWQLNSFHIS